MSTVNLHDEIERFRERLLDLSLRNPLLSYRKSKRRTLQVVNELPDVMYERLIESGKPFIFDFAPDPPKKKTEDVDQLATSLQDGSGGSADKTLATATGVSTTAVDPKTLATNRLGSGSHSSDEEAKKYPILLPEMSSERLGRNKALFDDKLQTNLTQERLNSTLRYMQREARTAMQETGINYLFLAIGFLAWKESDSSDKVRLAPLILIPVRIEKVSRSGGEPRFTIEWDEDEVQFNLSLQKKLARDFDLTLPDLPEGAKPEEYFRELQKAIKSKPEWSIRREAVLGFFSFHKLSMYADIDPANWDLTVGSESATIIEQLICGGDGTNGDREIDEATLYAPDYDVDRNSTAADLILSLDADSSQQSALVDIRSGRNLVIEGPPGTGKSQTITNAIADAIGAGKTVLFVAEKLAALQVVHDRMTALGLDDFCLELHSDAASPRQVFESLRDRMGAEYPSPKELDGTRESLAGLRDRLNHYVSEMAAPAGPCGDALYDMLWKIVALRGQGATFHRAAVQRMPRDRNAMQYAISELNVFANVLLETPNPKQWVWWGFFPEAYAFRQSDEIQSCIHDIEERSRTVLSSATELGQDWGMAPDETYFAADRLDIDAIRSFVDRTPPATANLAAELVDEQKYRACKGLLSLLHARTAAATRLKSEFGVAVASLQEKCTTIAPMLALGIVTLDDSIEDAGNALNWCKELRQSIVELKSNLDILSQVGIPPSDMLEDLSRCIKLVQLVQHPIVADPASVTKPMFDPNAIEHLRAAYKENNALLLAKQKANEKLDAIVSGSTCDVAQTDSKLGELDSSLEAFRSIAGTEHTLTDVAEIARWSAIAESATDVIIDVGGRMDLPGVSRPSNFDAFAKASTLVQLARHRVVAEPNCLRAPMFRSEGRNTFQQANRVAEDLLARRQTLKESFHMSSVPEATEVTKIAKTLRRHRRSWLKVLSGEYRSARANLDEFAAVGVKRKLNDWIRALEDLEVLSNEENEFSSREDLEAVFGDGFRGVDTDWETLRLRFDWVHTATQHGMDYASACSILTEKSSLLPDVSNVDLKQAESGFVSAWAETTSVSTKVADGNAKQVPLELLKRRVGLWAAAAKDLSAIASELKLPKDWTLARMMELIVALRERAKVDAITNAFSDNPEHRLRLGSMFSGQATDWKQLQMAVNWSSTARSAGADHERITSLFASRAEELARFDVKESLAGAKRIAGLFESAPKGESSSKRYQGMNYEELGSSLESAIDCLESGCRDAIEIGNSPQVRISALAQQVELSDRFSVSDGEIGDNDRWGLLKLSGVYQNVITSPVEIDSVLGWISDGRSLLSETPEAIRERMIASADVEAMTELCDRIRLHRECVKSVSDARQRLATFGRLDSSWLSVEIPSILAGETTDRAQTLGQKLDELPAWSKFCRSLDECSRLHLGDFAELAINGVIEPGLMSASYELSVFEIAAERAFEESEALRHGSGQTMDGLREEFQFYDRELRDLGKNEIASRAADRPVPSGNSKGRVGELTELALIRHESQKQRRHCRIRDLMQRAGTAVQALKPCLMMSPLSVSRFISESTVEFDMVIMDEASQIKPEDAIGTILRAKQLVVVGDPKQLPPTSFFDRTEEDLDDDESTQLDNTESVLEAAMKVFQPFRRLRWHYRSKHESLIRFSNSRFYDNDLVVFPSPSGDPEAYGIRHVFVEDATCTSGLNMKEAAAVVEEIVRHAISRPDESLGIGTFNKKQAEMISELLEKRCEKDAAAAIAVERLKQGEEELFIKNLENLQGDERDVIFVCYTYGKDPASKRLMQRFGPINSEKGWRRLNVLITRSRHRMVVFSSFHPGDIQGGPEKSRGVNAYKDFLSYAISGTIDDGGTVAGKAPDSPFEIAVCRTIEQMGLEAVPQVGVAGFFIDIGVRRRDGDRSFLLGVECDGATYHSARSARDRDRLREEIIRSRGWEIHRIWSTDWFLNQKAEEEKLKQSILNVTDDLYE
ncbi:DUF4011 domain-containing protein [Rubripirellula reticaptiva]|uniref:ATP-dependent RecD-like DNA helicase n=1 Tax=Rubripirellula reticaptiva TaxID=2528013 RepID=A0A5C6EDJ8_9BACT|nr:DUF4011 domain-containing protein [Rubripirellula reticaptiva]TWU46504.1 ATP-dependent RecD-like DNA helicase [Rubripirellula reticaptiva]